MQKFSVLYLLLLITSSCQESADKSLSNPSPEASVAEPPAIQHKHFYFPTDSLTQTRVYHFTTEDSDADMYWVMTSTLDNGKTLLATDLYGLNQDGELKLMESTREELKADGAYVTAYTEFKMDAGKEMLPAVAVMKSNCVFKWDLKETEPLLWSFEETMAQNPAFLQTTTRTRTYTGAGEPVFFQGDTLETIVLTDKFHLEMSNTQMGRTKTYDFVQTCYYADQVGMYRYVREMDSLKVAYTLQDILSNDAWLELLNKP